MNPPLQKGEKKAKPSEGCLDRLGKTDHTTSWHFPAASGFESTGANARVAQVPPRNRVYDSNDRSLRTYLNREVWFSNQRYLYENNVRKRYSASTIPIFRPCSSVGAYLALGCWGTNVVARHQTSHCRGRSRCKDGGRHPRFLGSQDSGNAEG